jgi:hypothetical protein
MTLVVGALLGIWGVRFRWRGLIALVVLSLVLPVISTSLALQFNPLTSGTQVNLRPANLAGTTALQFASLSIWYAIFAGVHWLFTRRKEQRSGQSAS